MNKPKTNVVDSILRNYFWHPLPESLEEEVQSWLADGGHAEEKDRALKRLWESVDAKPDQTAYAAFDRMRERLGFPSAPRLRPRRRLGWRVAAVLVPVLLIAATALWFDFGVPAPEAPPVALVSVEVPEGSRKQMVLSDHSEVWINAGTTITYAEEFTDRREVSLEGEAYFVVEEDADKPFIVQAGEVSVVVSGTSFNVNAYPEREQTVVILDEGSVEVEIGEELILLQPGQQFTYHHSSGKIEVGDAPAGRMNWHLATLDFDRRTLTDIFRSLEVIYGVTIVCPDPIGEEDTFSVRFTGEESLKEVFFVLEQMTGRFTSSFADDQVVIVYH